MAYTIIENKTVRHETSMSIQALLAKYNDMYKYAIYIGGNSVFVVVKNEQPTDWEIGWAE